MATIVSVLFCIVLLASLVYFLYAATYETCLAVYRRLPMQAQMRIDRLVLSTRRSV